MKRETGGTTPRRTQDERTATTRDALVRTARALFAEHGYAAVSTDSVVRDAGMTRGALYHHFADKTDLFAAVFEAVEADVTQQIAAAVAASDETDPLELMIRGAQAWLRAGADRVVHRIVLVDAPAVLGWVRWRRICLRYALGLVQALLDQAVTAGRIAEQPTLPLAHVLLGAADEAALFVALADDPGLARAQMDTAIATIVRSLAVT